MTEKADNCPLHGDQKQWCECWNCEDGYSSHDCGEDCCMCADPEPNVRCDICRGKGGWWRCYICAPETEEAL